MTADDPATRLTRHWDLLRTIRSFGLGTWPCLGAVFAVQFCFFGLYSVVFNLFLRRLGYPVTLIGLANAAVAIGGGIAAIPAGHLGVRWGCRRMVIGGLFGGALFSLVLPFSVYCPPEFGKVIVVASYGLFGVAGVLAMVNAVPFLANRTCPSTRTQVFAIYGSIAPIGQFAGSVAGGVAPGLLARVGGFSLERADPYGLSLWLAPVVMLIFAFLVLGTKGETDQTGPAHTRHATGRAPFALFFIFFISTGLRDAASFGIGVFFNLYLDVAFGVAVAIIGMVLALSKVIPGVGGRTGACPDAATW